MTKSHIRLLPPSDLKPHERTDSGRIRSVVDLLVRDQVWTRPICIEEQSLCVMDGHHRRLAAIHLGLAVVPVVAFTYDEVRLGSWRAGMGVEADELIDRAMKGALLPPKSTRHVFPPFDVVAIPLANLLLNPAHVARHYQDKWYS